MESISDVVSEAQNIARASEEISQKILARAKAIQEASVRLNKVLEGHAMRDVVVARLEAAYRESIQCQKVLINLVSSVDAYISNVTKK